MRACNVYILGLNTAEHRASAHEILAILKNTPLTAGEYYTPHVLLHDNTEDLETYMLETNMLENSKHGPADLIICPGNFLSKITEFYKKPKQIPTIFFGFSLPGSETLFASIQKIMPCISGVLIKIPESFTGTQNELKFLYPTVRKIFMPYDTRLNFDTFSIESIIQDGVIPELEALNFTVTTQKVSSREEALEVIINNLDTHHAIASCGLHIDTEEEIAYLCRMTNRLLISDKNTFASQNIAGAFFTNSSIPRMYTEVVQMLRTFWCQRIAVNEQPIIKIYSLPGHLIINKFLLPYWALPILDNIPVNTPNITVINKWVDCPFIKKDNTEDSRSDNDKKIDHILDQIELLQDCLF